MMGRARELRRAEIKIRAKTRSESWIERPAATFPAGKIPNGCTRVFENNLHIAFVYDNTFDPEDRAAVMVQVRNNSGLPVGWKVLQGCKNDIFGPEVRAVQYLPRESELVDVANLYWFFVRKSEIKESKNG